MIQNSINPFFRSYPEIETFESSKSVEADNFGFQSQDVEKTTHNRFRHAGRFGFVGDFIFHIAQSHRGVNKGDHHGECHREDKYHNRTEHKNANVSAQQYEAEAN